jgi:ribosomal protein L37AE/L43A
MIHGDEAHIASLEAEIAGLKEKVKELEARTMFQPWDVCHSCRKLPSENREQHWYCQECVDRIHKELKRLQQL